MLTTPRKFQLDGVKAIENFGGRALLADSVGLGKTVQFLLWAERNVPAHRSIVVACPAGIKYNWAKEVKKHWGIEATVAESFTAPPRVWKRPKILIVNYDILQAWLTYLVRLEPYAVCLDEAVAIKNKDTQRTVAAIRMCRGVPAVVAMTATPLVNRPSDLWTILHILDRAYWGVYYAFVHRYGAPRKGFRGRWVFDGSSNEEELNQRLLETCLIRRRKEDVLKDLPPILHNPISLAVSAKAMQEYRLAERDLKEWVRQNMIRQGSSLKGDEIQLRNKTMVLKQLVARIKLDAVAEWVETFLESGERLLLFCHHILMVNALAKKFKGCAVVNGAVVGRKRQQEYDRFNDGDTPLLVGNMDACGTGWSVTGCSNVAIAEYPWRPDSLLQAIGRCHGINRGQQHVPTTGHYLSVAGTIEEDVCQTLLRKQSISDKIVDGKDLGQLDVLNEVVLGLLEKK